MNQPLVSIVIPAYNAEQYIEACLNSLYAQMYQNIEIIVAYDEKSTDNTLHILQSYAVHKDNLIIDIGIDKGSGDARNRGFKFATGEYVIFVDADDEVMPDYLTTLLQIFKQHPELNVAFFCLSSQVHNGDVESARKLAEKSPHISGLATCNDLLYKKLWHKFASAPWAYLVKRDFLVENNIVFPPYSHADDSFYSYQLIDKAGVVGYTKRRLYLFYQNETSITHTLPDYWWRKYEPFARDMVAYFSQRNPSFATDFERNIYRILAYMSARRLSYKDFIAEMEHFGVKKLSNMKHNDKFFVMCSAWCFNISKRLYWCMVRVMNSMINKFSPLTQR